MLSRTTQESTRRLSASTLPSQQLTSARILPVVLFLLVTAVTGARPVTADWPMYRMDAGRTGYTSEELPEQLSLRWAHKSMHPPMPAWPRSDRMTYDRANHVVVADAKVIFGSSANGIVRALDADSGSVLWRFYTDAPIRFAPAAWRDRVFVASDDGHLYSLSLKDGQLLWKQRGGPDHSSVLGNQRLVSKWPARGGPVVVGDIVYFAAGIWPSDGIFLYALNADNGGVLWCNDDSGEIYMPQPHGGANAKSGVSAQGYLAVAEDHLLVPTGRAVPAAFNRLTGEFQYLHLQKYGHNGGSSILAVGETFFNNGLGFSSASGEKTITLGAGALAAVPDGLVRADGKKLETYRWLESEQPDRKGQPVKKRSLEREWSIDDITNTTALIVAGDKIVCGTNSQVTVIDMATRNAVWSGEVDGTVYGLVATDGKLLVTTDRGLIYCFEETTGVTSSDTQTDAIIVPKTNERYGQAAEEIIKLSGITEGYCLDLGCGDGSLAYELARRTGLHICAVDDDPAMVAAARQKLTAAGIYGVQVTVQQRDLEATGYPQYFANLIVSGRLVDEGGDSPPVAQVKRLQRPSGGAICIGEPGKMKVQQRDALAGAGTWTHQYADAANTLVSDDTLVGGRLSMLWFRDVDFDIPSRHGRAPAPLYDGGRLFHQGNDGICAVDAYNGHELWRYEIQGLLKAYDGDELMGVAGTGSNCCLGGDSVYVRDGKRCLKLDAATGTLVREFQPPPRPDGQPGTWGYVAWVDNVLYGTVAVDEHVVTYRYRDTTGDMSKLLTESHSLFAMDAETGDLIWTYKATDSIRHNALAIGKGKVFLIDRPIAMFDREKRPKTKEHQTGKLLALDAKTGTQVWTDDADIYGTMLAVSEEHGVLLMSYQPTRFRLDSEIGGRMTAFKTEDGQKLWENKADYESRPMINGGTVYAQGGAWSLLSGEPEAFNFKRSYGCGILAASKNMMLFRSATLGYFDIKRNDGIDDYGGIRPGCWVNVLPAGGLVLLPDATAGCRCSYLNKAWVALIPNAK